MVSQKHIKPGKETMKEVHFCRFIEVVAVDPNDGKCV